MSRKIYWDDTLKTRFAQVNMELCKLVSEGLTYYDKSHPTIVLTDWSKGMGFVALQQYCSCISLDVPFCCNVRWKLALCGGRRFSNEEINYASIEGEAAAAIWCLKKACLILLGCPNLVPDNRSPSFCEIVRRS